MVNVQKFVYNSFDVEIIDYLMRISDVFIAG